MVTRETVVPEPMNPKVGKNGVSCARRGTKAEGVSIVNPLMGPWIPPTLRVHKDSAPKSSSRIEAVNVGKMRRGGTSLGTRYRSCQRGTPTTWATPLRSNFGGRMSIERLNSRRDPICRTLMTPPSSTKFIANLHLFPDTVVSEDRTGEIGVDQTSSPFNAGFDGGTCLSTSAKTKTGYPVPVWKPRHPNS